MRISFTVCLCVCVCHAVHEIDKFGSRYLVEGFSEPDEIGSLIEEVLLFTPPILVTFDARESSWAPKY